jgi:starch-binding outer membrane protein, SusD/RagB family
MNIMKKLTQYIIIALFALSLGSCEKFLQSDLHQAINVNDAINNLEDAQVALNGCYDGLQEIELFARDLYVIADLAADNSKLDPQNSGRFISIYQWNIVKNDGWVTGVWNLGYGTLYRINKLIIDVKALTDVDEAEQGRILGEALALRSLMNFELVNFFGQTYNFTSEATHLGIPLITTLVAVDDKPGRATVKQVYDQILLDLEGDDTNDGAIDLLSSNESPFYIDIYGAYALLSRVYLYMENWEKASSYAMMVINSGKYALVPKASFKDSWFLSSFNQNSEQIFYLTFSEVDNWSVDMLSQMYMETGYGDILATTDLVDLYESGDVRLGWFRDAGSQIFIEKYPGQRESYDTPEEQVNISVNNHPIFRFAEMYLNAAEAEAMLGNDADAQALVDEITNRAGASPAIETGAALLEKIQAERRKELCFEGQRLSDIKRWKQDLVREDLTSPDITALVEYKSPLFAYPIPDREILVNPVIEQNPGY